MDAQTAIRDQVSEAEWALRVDLAAAFRISAHYGWDDLIFTHTSVRVPGPEKHFLINPFNLAFDEMTASNMVKIDLLGAPVIETEHMVNPAGFTIHSAIHEARDDARCVYHLHTVDGQAVAAQRRGLLPISQTAMAMLADVAYHDYEGIAFNPEEKARLVADIGDKHCLILRNHGLLTVGEDVSQAFLRMYFLQKACEVQVKAQAAGEVLELGADIWQHVSEQAAGVAEMVATLSWAAVLRKLDRIDPGYRD